MRRDAFATVQSETLQRLWCFRHVLAVDVMRMR